MEPPINVVGAPYAFVRFVRIAGFERPPPAIGYARTV
jgi:hypothetical protein